MKIKYYMYNNKHKGIVGFEYIIILIIMSVALFMTFNILQKSLKAKGENISEFIGNNGQNSLAGGSGTNNGNNDSNSKDTSDKGKQIQDNSPRKWKLIDPEFHNKYCESWNQFPPAFQGIVNGNIYDYQLRKYMEDKNITNVRVIDNAQDIYYNKQLENGFMINVSVKVHEPNTYTFMHIIDPAYTVDKDITIGTLMTIDQLITAGKAKSR